MHDEYRSIVIENGSGFLKAGFAGEDQPRTVFSNLVGRLKNSKLCNQNKDFFIGDEAQTRRAQLSLKYPMSCGIVTNWDDMENVWHHTFYNELKAAPEEHPVFLTDTVLNPKINREKMIQIMFERFSVPAFYVSTSPQLSLYASGRATGVVVEIGEGVTQVVPVFEGCAVSRGIKRLNFAGNDCTEYLMRLLTEKGCYFMTSAEKEIVREMKEKIGCVAMDFDEIKKQDEISYELPDGNIIKLGDERFHCAEALFTPSLVTNEDTPGASALCFESIKQSSPEMQRDLFSNIVLSGGSTMFTGFPERFTNEITQMAPASLKIKVCSNTDTKYICWIGGSIVASLSTFQASWITKEEYEEFGPEIVFRKCTEPVF